MDGPNEMQSRKSIHSVMSCEDIEGDVKFQESQRGTMLRIDETPQPSPEQYIDLEQALCKICLCEEEEDNPIVSPCICAGSVGHVHLHCLRQWLDSKKKKLETNQVNSYIWKDLVCEICHSNYQ